MALSALSACKANKIVKTVIYAAAAAAIVVNGWQTFSAPAFSYGSYNIFGRQVGVKYERDEWFIGNYYVMRWLADNVESAEPVSVGKLNTQFSIFENDVKMLPQAQRERINIYTEEPEYIILRYDTPASESLVVEGYEHIKEFEAYGIKQYAILKKTN